MLIPQTYIDRCTQLKKQLNSGVILLLGNEESPMNYADNGYHFRQDSSFLYFFGMDYPSLAAWIDVDTGEEILFGDNLTMDMIVWMGTQPSLEERAEKYGIHTVQPLARLPEYISNAGQTGRTIHFLPPYRPENKIKLFNLLGIHPDQCAERASLDLVKAVIAQRQIKSEEEIKEIEKAVDISADMHMAAIRMARPGMTEAEIAAKVNEVALAANGNISFPIIATINGQTLHNHYHGNIIREGDLFLLDAGAETNLHYAGDISSTFPVSSRFTERQKEIYTITLNAHEAAISALKPGVPFKEAHMTACRTIFDGLKELGLTKGNTDEAVAAGAHTLFFPCGTGHMLGLDVHDMEDLGELWVGYDGVPKSTEFGFKSLRLAKPLQPGFVVTIEPGIYFIPELIDMWKAKGKHTGFLNYEKIEAYRNFGGIRNEEDLLITDSGSRVLGKPIPKKISEVEELRQ
ncbi:MAG: aminopeptidase P family protein [Bacteroidales bacterium]|nr:aminopeptidase P family protein [Bacteroidales bacterium]